MKIDFLPFGGEFSVFALHELVGSFNEETPRFSVALEESEKSTHYKGVNSQVVQK